MTDIPDKEQLVFAWRKYNDEDITFEEAEADIDRYSCRAREQQLLTEIMGELPKKLPAVRDGSHTQAFDDGFNSALSIVVAVIKQRMVGTGSSQDADDAQGGRT